MRTDSKWTFLGATPDSQKFQIEGVDVWQHQWHDTKDRADVEDPLYHQKFCFHVYEIVVGGKSVRFAAGEFSACMWGFYVRQ